MRALRRALTIPYTVKLRAGWDDTSRNAVEIARMAEGEGVSMIAVHGRTRQQLYTGRSDWDVIAAVKQAVRVPVVGSGDIEHAADALERLATTGVDGIMIGRGTLGHPWIFREIAALRAGAVPTPVGLIERLAAIDTLLERLVTDLPPESAIGRARGLACRMIKFVRGGAAIREALTRAPSIDAMRELLAEAANAPTVAALALAAPGGRACLHGNVIVNAGRGAFTRYRNPGPPCGLQSESTTGASTHRQPKEVRLCERHCWASSARACWFSRRAAVGYAQVNCGIVNKDLKMGRTAQDIAERMMISIDDVKKCEAEAKKDAPAPAARGRSGGRPAAGESRQRLPAA